MATKMLDELEKKKSAAGTTSGGGSLPVSGYKSPASKSNTPASADNPRLRAMQQYLQDTVGGVPTESELLRNVREKLLNRQPYSYDHNTDVRFQQYLDTAKRSGRMAMRDTMGQAAALTGGYANSFAQSAGQQAFNDYMQDANEMIPEFEELARARYDAETAALGDRYSILQSEHESAKEDYWNRYGIAREDWNNELDRATAESQYEDEKKAREIELLIALGDYDALDRMGYNTSTLRSQYAADMAAAYSSASNGSDDESAKGLSSATLNSIEKAFSSKDYDKAARYIYNAYNNGEISYEQSMEYLRQYSRPLSSFDTLSEVANYLSDYTPEEIKSMIDSSDLSTRKKSALYNHFHITHDHT